MALYGFCFLARRRQELEETPPWRKSDPQSDDSGTFSESSEPEADAVVQPAAVVLPLPKIPRIIPIQDFMMQPQPKDRPTAKKAPAAMAATPAVPEPLQAPRAWRPAAPRVPRGRPR